MSSSSWGVFKIPFTKLAPKYGTQAPLGEAVTLRYLAQNTKVPVPKVYCALREENITYILMDWVEGET
jgi:fructosamine-3-kinase